jgi:hypothetical protein
LKNADWAEIIVEVFEQSVLKRKSPGPIFKKESLKDPKGGKKATKKNF